MNRWALHGICTAATLLCTVSAGAQTMSGTSGSAGSTRFAVRVENISTEKTLKLAKGGSLSMPLSSGVWVVHTGGNPILTPGKLDAGLGLKGLAEAGMAAPLAANLARVPGVRSRGLLDKPMMRVGAKGAAAGGMNLPARGMGKAAGSMGAGRDDAGKKPAETLMPAEGAPMIMAGTLADVIFEARPGDRLSLAFMLGHSNDGIIGTGAAGIALFDASGRPISGDVSSALGLWDAGTEVNEEPGVGRNQGMRQGAPNAGDPERRPVRAMSDSEFGRQWPAAASMLRVTITPVTR